MNNQNEFTIDRLLATSSLYSSDFSNIATLSVPKGELPLDLIITNVSVPLQEFSKVDSHIGDTFSVHYYGKAPLMVNIIAVLVDTVNGYNKNYLMDLYVNKLRMKAIARTGVMPSLNLPGMTLTGGIVNLNISDASEMHSIINISFSMLVFHMVTMSPMNKSGVYINDIDYTKRLTLSSSEKTSDYKIEYTDPTKLSSGSALEELGSPKTTLIGKLESTVGSTVSEIVGTKMAMDFGTAANPFALPEDRMFNGLTGFMGYGNNEAAILATKYTNPSNLTGIENAIINDAIIQKQMSPYANSLTSVPISSGDLLGTLRGKGLIDSVTNKSVGYLKDITNSLGLEGPLKGIVADSIPGLKKVINTGLKEALYSVPGVKELHGYMDMANGYLTEIDGMLKDVINFPNQKLRELTRAITAGGNSLVDKLPDGIAKDIARAGVGAGTSAVNSEIRQYYRDSIGGYVKDASKVRREFSYWYKDVLRTPNHKADTERAVTRYQRRMEGSITNRTSRYAEKTVRDIVSGVFNKTTTTQKPKSNTKIIRRAQK